jgi:hypothetical protein
MLYFTSKAEVVLGEVVCFMLRLFYTRLTSHFLAGRSAAQQIAAVLLQSEQQSASI